MFVNLHDFQSVGHIVRLVLYKLLMRLVSHSACQRCTARQGVRIPGVEACLSQGKKNFSQGHRESQAFGEQRLKSTHSSNHQTKNPFFFTMLRKYQVNLNAFYHRILLLIYALA